MSARTIDNPGIELNEIDRSAYGKIDNSLPNSPTSLIFGVSDKGEDQTFEWIDSKATLDDTFGIPTTEFESYFYNAAIEILNKGGTCIASKLPYDNEQYQKFNYVEYIADEISYVNQKMVSANTDFSTIDDIHQSLSSVLEQLNMSTIGIDTINGMAQKVQYLNTIISTDIMSNNASAINTISELSGKLCQFIDNYVGLDPNFALLYLNDSNLTSYLNIKMYHSSESNDQYGRIGAMSCLDDFLVSRRSLHQGIIRIYDMTRAKYESLLNYNCVSSESLSTWTNECLGIVPVIVAPANALFFQNLLQFNKLSTNVSPDYSAFNCVSSFTTIYHPGIDSSALSNIASYMSLPLASQSEFEDEPIASIDSLSRRAAQQFPSINFYDQSHFDKTNLKKIGVVVFKAFRDTSNSGKLSFQLLESFVGALEKNARDEMTNASIFIDNIVNSQSQFIRLFSNVKPSLVQEATTFTISRQPAISLGFYKEDCKKNISYLNTIMKPLTSMLDKGSNRTQLPIDIVVDAGVSNIAQLALNQINSTLQTDIKPYVGDYSWSLGSDARISGWKAILSKFDNFCKSQRKDCMFVADGLRPMCLEGNQKMIRATKPENTVANTIIPKFRLIANAVDSSYSAGYCNWFMQRDYSNNQDYIWIPPSIKAAGSYIYCDTYFHPWSAPAGQVRGLVGDAVDIAFIPTEVDGGIIYSNSWNYAMSYPTIGIVIEGHKTFQSQRTALDRINVRRLMLSLEKKVARVASQFVYEQNTPFMRQTFVDSIRPILEDAVSGDGIKEYAIKCDDELNTPEVIENNEMRCKIAVKPVKVVDYIVITFICTNQSMSVTEEVLK